MKNQLPAYLLMIDADQSCNYVSIDEDREYIDYHGKRLPEDWTLPPHVLDPKRLPIRDITTGIDRVFVSQYALDSFSALLGDHVEFRKIGQLKGTEYYLMHVLTIVDCLDLSKSDISSCYKGNPASVYSMVFDTSVTIDAPIFKIPQDVNPILVTSPFVECVRENRISGVGFADPTITSYFFPEPAFDDFPILD